MKEKYGVFVPSSFKSHHFSPNEGRLKHFVSSLLMEGSAGRRSIRIGIEVTPLVFLSASTPARVVPAKSVVCADWRSRR
jgi:hypothetical protein